MAREPSLHHRRSIRLADYDYAQAGAYFITIVCRERALLLEDPVVRTIVEESWLWMAERYDHMELDDYVLMPNHVHGIVMLTDVRRGGSRTSPTTAIRRKPLGRLIGAFKTVSTKRVNRVRQTPGRPFWQRNYYERIMRDEDELNRIRLYIIDNPARWDDDPENPASGQKIRVGAVREPPTP